MDRAVFGTAFAPYARSLCSVARFSLPLDRDDKVSIIFRDPFDCAALATPSPLAQGDKESICFQRPFGSHGYAALTQDDKKEGERPSSVIRSE